MGVARAFGRRGFQVALIARTATKLDALVDEPAAQGITAAATATPSPKPWTPLRNWAHALHDELGPKGIHAATVTIASGVIPGDPVADPDAIGARYLDLYERRDRPEEVIGDIDAFRTLVVQASTPQR
jgi:hypothetical protein